MTGDRGRTVLTAAVAVALAATVLSGGGTYAVLTDTESVSVQFPTWTESPSPRTATTTAPTPSDRTATNTTESPTAESSNTTGSSNTTTTPNTTHTETETPDPTGSPTQTATDTPTENRTDTPTETDTPNGTATPTETATPTGNGTASSVGRQLDCSTCGTPDAPVIGETGHGWRFAVSVGTRGKEAGP